jgi:hypothetical protein
MDSFDNILKVASHIKSYQLSFDKKKFDSLPEFYKTGLYYSDGLIDIITSNFNTKKESFNKLKEEGIAKLKENNFDDAIYLFCKCLCIFKYIRSSIKDWKKEAIKDEDLTYYDDKGSNETEKNEITQMKISVLLNIALCALGQESFEEARQACDEVIKLDSRNIKA